MPEIAPAALTSRGSGGQGHERKSGSKDLDEGLFRNKWAWFDGKVSVSDCVSLIRLNAACSEEALQPELLRRKAGTGKCATALGSTHGVWPGMYVLICILSEDKGPPVPIACKQAT